MELNTKADSKKPLLEKEDPHDHHDHHHDHGHHHNIGKEDHEVKSKAALKKLILVSIICVIFMGVEVVGGYIAQSLAIMTDAAHLLSDFSGFLISMFSIWIARKPASDSMSYGYHRSEIIGALGSVILIWGLTIWLVYEATLRIYDPKPVNGLIMLIISGVGLLCNIVMAGVLHSGHGHSHGGHSHGGHDHGHDHGHSHGHDEKPAIKTHLDSDEEKYFYSSSSEGKSHFFIFFSPTSKSYTTSIAEKAFS
jgi:zinc transporter 2